MNLPCWASRLLVTGVLIATAVSGSALNRGDYERFGNNQLQVADVRSGELRPLLTGPKGCEITGLTASPNGRNLFINIQHPGELAGGGSEPAKPLAWSAWPTSQFPELTGGRPRSGRVVIRRQDTGVVGP